MKINQNVVVLREALTKIVPLLTNEQVRVTMRGMNAFVEYDPKTLKPVRVNIPYLPDDASDELIAAVQGFLDHEVGHILFSDAVVLGKATKMGKEISFLNNAIEDTFIERRMTETFRGSAYNLSNTLRFFVDKMVTPRVDLAKALGKTDEVISSLIVPAVRAWSNQPEALAFMKGRWVDIADFEGAVGPALIERFPKCQSSQDCLDLAIDLYAAIKNEMPKPPPEDKGNPGKGESGKGKPEKGEKQKGEPGKGDDQADEGEGGESDKPEKAEKGAGKPAPEKSEDKGATAGKEGDDEKGSEESDEAGSGAEAGDGPDGPDEADDDGADGTTSNPMNSKLIKGVLAAIMKETGFDDGLAKIIGERCAQEFDTSDYLVFSRDEDRIENIKPGPEAIKGVPDMQNAVDHMIGPLQKDIERMMAARSAVVWTGGHKRGKIDVTALSRMQFGSDKVFRRKQDNTSKDVAVELVVDCSGSMTTQSKLRTAVHTAYALSSILDRLGISNEVIGFTTLSMSDEMGREMMKDGNRYARMEAINMPIFKGFDERMSSEVKSRFVHATQARGLCVSNVDGESVLIAARRLAVRREARKVLMVLSDGRPAVMGGGADLDGHLKAVVKSVEAGGIDVVGLGICDDSVRKFYKRHLVMTSVNDLPTTVMGELKRLLTK